MFGEGMLILIAIMALAVFTQNQSVAYAVAILLVLKLLRLNSAIEWLDEQGLKWSIIFLTAAILAPFASGKVSISEIYSNIKTPVGITALLMGCFATYLAREGVNMMDTRPDLVPALIGGTIIGVSFFQGVAVGPLVASGILAFIFSIVNRFFN
ncbi:DUF441 domain-containing protein [Proteinivorax hydrogeniformans]|uniref:UPF0756 membrane protein PRVXH_000471 n=1 Tax=Proteinivorax hydrogeniformans TaxID=1826727 RepID=A0AAU8HUV3_9FIRM